MLLTGKCCDQCSIQIENVSRPQSKLFGSFANRFSVRFTKLFSFLKRTRSERGEGKDKGVTSVTSDMTLYIVISELNACVVERLHRTLKESIYIMRYIQIVKKV
jgi:hypothetical protein